MTAQAGGHPKLPHDGDYGLAGSWQVVREWRRIHLPVDEIEGAGTPAAPNELWVSIAVLAFHWYYAEASICGVNFQRGGTEMTLAAALAYAVLEWPDPSIT